MGFVTYASMPLIGAAIGWVTNWLAVKLIFRPHRPVNLWFYTLQGVVPKRRAELARSIGEVVERELISTDDLLERIKAGEFMDGLSRSLSVTIKARVMNRLPAFVPLSIKRAVSDFVADQIQKEVPGVIGDALDRFGVLMKEKFSFQKMVEDRINAFSLDRLEEMVLSVSARELRHVELMGGVLGFVIGVFQAAMVYITRAM
ncbi:MAG: DUF445 domain-containing protein [Bacillota bacterium]